MALLNRGLRGMKVVRRFFHSTETNSFKKLPDPWDVATGLERWEAVQYAKGNTNPFFMKPAKRGPGTKDCPNVVFSVHDKRIVGCLCHDDNHHLVWWWLHEGFPRRCECNHWFVLERVEMPKMYEDED